VNDARFSGLIAAVLALAALSTTSCAHEGGEARGATAGATASSAATAPTGMVPQWLCRPEGKESACRDADLTATELLPDGSQVVVPYHAAERPSVDCFYVYPTVDLDLVPGNHTSFAETRPMRGAALAQAARFGEACALWVPLYRQVTIGTYLQSPATLEHGLAIAFSDVERAFAEYLAHSDPQRKIVLIGHSQGAEMVVRLLRRFFDNDASLRARLLLALPIGGDADVAAGSTRGGTFQNIPVCTRPDETACMVAYRTYSAADTVDPDRWKAPPGRETVCVDPAALDRGDAPDQEERLSRAYFSVRPELRAFLHGVSEVKTPFVVLRNFYTARCVRGPGAFGYLAAAPAPSAADQRRSPVDFADKRLRIGKLGLHVLDLQLTQGDLIDMVARRAKANAESASQGSR
jgi:hypothetical protein